MNGLKPIAGTLMPLIIMNGFLLVTKVTTARRSLFPDTMLCAVIF